MWCSVKIAIFFLSFLSVPAAYSDGKSWHGQAGVGVGYRNHFGVIGMEGALISPRKALDLNLAMSLGMYEETRLSVGARVFSSQFSNFRAFAGGHFSHITGYKKESDDVDGQRYIFPHYNALHVSGGIRSFLIQSFYIQFAVGYQMPLGDYKIRPLSDSQADQRALEGSLVRFKQGDLEPGISYSIVIGSENI